MRPGLPISLLIAANLLPVAGVLWLDWDVFGLLLLFWFENVVIGIYGIARIILSGADRVSDDLIAPLFFLAHYGLFMFVHFMVLFGLYETSINLPGGEVAPVDYLARLVGDGLWLPIAALFISHGVSFVQNVMGRREYDVLTPGEAMMLPYRRVVITQVALLGGGFMLARTGEPLPGLLLLLALKIVIDLRQHRREHAQLAQASAGRARPDD